MVENTKKESKIAWKLLIEPLRVYETRKPSRPAFPTPRYDFAPSTTSTSRPFSDPESYESDAPPGACYESLMNNIITPLMKFPQYEYPPNTVRFQIKTIDVETH